jgi:hypothetical protein
MSTYLDRPNLSRGAAALFLLAAPLIWFVVLCDGELFVPAESLRHSIGKNHTMALEILASGGSTDAFHPPGYAAIVAGIYGLFGPEPGWVRVVQAVLLPVPIFCAMRVGRALGGGGVAWFAALAMALHPAAPQYATNVHSDFLVLVAVSMVAGGALPSLVGGRGSPWMAALGLALAVWVRPAWALLGPLLLLGGFGVAGWRKSVRTLAPAALLSIVVLMVNLAWFPPEPGAVVRGSHAASASLLLGSWQYEGRWWDWRFVGPGDANYERFREHEDAIIASVPGKGRPHPDVKAAIRAAAWERYEDRDRMLKKVAISSVRLWVLFPTGASPPIQFAFVALDLLLLLLALRGLALLGRRSWLILPFLAVPLLLHGLMHVEPRYAVPARAVWYVCAVVGATGSVRPRLRKSRD